jgi:gluconokinase
MSTVFDEAVLEERPEVDLSALPSLHAERDPVTVLALDIGTSGTRAALFNQRGEQIQGSFVELQREKDSSEFLVSSDFRVEPLFRCVTQLIDLAVERAERVVSRIDYVAVSCYWHSLVGINEAGEPITPLLGWADTRATAEVSELRNWLDERTTHARTGCRFHPSFWPAKLLWLEKYTPVIFGQVRHWLSFSDYLYREFFGTTATSVSMASATGLLNQHTGEWDKEVLSALPIGKDQLPPIAALRKTSGGLRDEFMLRWPMLDRAAWFQAIGDGAANNIGSGCVSREQVALMLGTSGALRLLSSRAAPATLPPELFCYRADTERVVIGGALSDGGALLRWLLDNFRLPDDLGKLNRELELMEADAHGLTILPFWSGERAPGWTSNATGTILGFTAATRSLDIARAILESIAYRFSLIGRALESFTPDASIILNGKVFHLFPVWAQVMADVFGREVELSDVSESSLRGAALLALETIGTIDTLETIKAGPGRRFAPDMQRHEVYRRAILRQQDLYRRLLT